MATDISIRIKELLSFINSTEKESSVTNKIMAEALEILLDTIRERRYDNGALADKIKEGLEIYHPETGKKVFILKKMDSFPNWIELNYAGTGNHSFLFCDDLGTWKYNVASGTAAINVTTTEGDAERYHHLIGVNRYYFDEKDEYRMDNVCGLPGQSQYRMWNKQGELMLEIDSTGKLQIPGYLKESSEIVLPWKGKKIVWIGDSLMTGYPGGTDAFNSDGDSINARLLGYPFILGQMTGAQIKLIALPGATARTHDLDGNVLNRDRCLMRTRAEISSLYGGNLSTAEAQRALKFSYEGELSAQIEDADLIIFGMGGNDIGVDMTEIKGKYTSIRSDSEFAEGNGVPIDTTDRRYYTGAFNTLLKYIYGKRITARVALLTRLTSCDAQALYPFNGNRLILQRQRALAEHWSLPLLCPADILGWNYNGDDSTSRMLHYCPDGTHPTVQEGKREICNAIIHEIEKKGLL